MRDKEVCILFSSALVVILLPERYCPEFGGSRKMNAAKNHRLLSFSDFTSQKLKVTYVQTDYILVSAYVY